MVATTKNGTEVEVKDNAIAIVNFLKENQGDWYFARQLATALDIASVNSVNGIMTSLVNKGVAVKEKREVVQEVPEGEKAKKPTTATFYTITDFGMTYDPVIAAIEKAEEKERAKAEKAAAKAATKEVTE